VFQGLVEGCWQNPPPDECGEEQGPPGKRQKVAAREPLQIPLEDPEEEIKALVEHLHQADRFWKSVTPVISKEGAARILHLTPIAFKYDMQGNPIITPIITCAIVMQKTGMSYICSVTIATCFVLSKRNCQLNNGARESATCTIDAPYIDCLTDIAMPCRYPGHD
jgi:hypothetical protein